MLDARRRACLEAMGIELWRLVREPSGRAQPVGTEEPASNLPDAVNQAAPATGIERRPTATSAPPAPPVEIDSQPAVAPPAIDYGRPDPGSLDWQGLEAEVARCTACALHQNRTQTVFGVGDRKARLLIIGEAPGAEEDKQGEPFVGRAGQLLNAMLAAIGLRRDQVFIANIVKCRPPRNRDPHADEAAACRPFLLRQISLIEPALILSVGRVSAQNLLATDVSVGRLRGRAHRFQPGDIPLIVTYHPAYLLRRPEEKAKAWADLQAAYRLLNAPLD